jgi:hypothetical protein
MADQIMPHTALSLSMTAKVKALTRFLIEGLPLPGLLEQYGHILFAFTSGAGAATSLYHYIQQYRENRAKIKLAVFHFTRMLENVPDFEIRLNDPHKLIADLDKEVSRLVGIHLTNSEAASTMLHLKRKVWTDVDGQRALARKRRMISPSVAQSSVAEEGLAQTSSDAAGPNVQLSSQCSEADIQEHLLNVEEEWEDVTMTDVECLAPLESPMPKEEYSSSQKTSRSPPTHYGFDSTPCPEGVISSRTTPNLPILCQVSSSPVCGTTHQISSSSNSDASPSSPTPAPRQKSVTSSGYGLDYNDEDLYPPSPPALTEISSTEQQQVERAVTKKSLTLLEAATIRAFDPNAFGNRPYRSPVVSKPLTTIKRQPPPNTMAALTRNITIGTWLLPIQEGVSPQDSPPSSTTEYRVAETRKYYKDVLNTRKVRRSFRDCFNRGEDFPPAQQEEVAVDEDKDDKQEARSQEWPDPTLTYSSDGDDSAVDVSESLPSLQSVESPPSALSISPTFPSPLSEPRTPEVSSPPLPRTSSSPLNVCKPPSKVSQTTSCTSSSSTTVHPPNVAMKRSFELMASLPHPSTASSSSKRRSRPKKVSAGSQTPISPLRAPRKSRRRVSKPDTPAGVRKSARKSAYKGSFTR